MNLNAAAALFARKPGDVDALTNFMEALASEDSVEIIKGILPLDFERIAGAGLTRLTELLPDDIDLLLSTALWKFHFGQDEEAREYLERAKRIDPNDIRILQVEIFLGYPEGPEHVLRLCEKLLLSHPSDDWTRKILDEIERNGGLTSLKGPPITLQWQLAASGVI